MKDLSVFLSSLKINLQCEYEQIELLDIFTTFNSDYEIELCDSYFSETCLKFVLRYFVLSLNNLITYFNFLQSLSSMPSQQLPSSNSLFFLFLR